MSEEMGGIESPNESANQEDLGSSAEDMDEVHGQLEQTGSKILSIFSNIVKALGIDSINNHSFQHPGSLLHRLQSAKILQMSQQSQIIQPPKEERINIIQITWSCTTTASSIWTRTT
jgi:hypothetical protein